MARKTQQTGFRTAVTACLLLLLSALNAQEELEYRMEVGGGAGVGFYLGDANSAPFANLSGMGGVMMRRILNPRMAVKANLLMGHVRGNSEGVFIPTDPNSQTPEGGIPTTVKFSRKLVDVGAQFEMNFWGYGQGGGYKGNSPITPYALAGIGFTLVPGAPGTRLALNLPIGVGVKYKLRPRLNVGFEWSVRFSTTDELDAAKGHQQLTHPYGIKSIGLKNKDCYSFTMVFLTYDISPKYRKCNN